MNGCSRRDHASTVSSRAGASIAVDQSFIDAIEQALLRFPTGCSGGSGGATRQRGTRARLRVRATAAAVRPGERGSKANRRCLPRLGSRGAEHHDRQRCMGAISEPAPKATVVVVQHGPAVRRPPDGGRLPRRESGSLRRDRQRRRLPESSERWRGEHGPRERVQSVRQCSIAPAAHGSPGRRRNPPIGLVVQTRHHVRRTDAQQRGERQASCVASSIFENQISAGMDCRLALTTAVKATLWRARSARTSASVHCAPTSATAPVHPGDGQSRPSLSVKSPVTKWALALSACEVGEVAVAASRPEDAFHPGLVRPQGHCYAAPGQAVVSGGRHCVRRCGRGQNVAEPSHADVG